MSLASDLRERSKDNKTSDHKILVIDIENGPNLAAVWGLFNQNIGIDMIHESSSVLCFAAKWLGDKEVFFYSDYWDGHDEMIRQAHRLLSEATAVITYNGDKHDFRHLNREFLLAGLPAPSPSKSIDLLKTIRQRFAFPSNKLDYVAQALGIGSKVRHPGYSMWKDAMTGSPDEKKAAWKLFKEYNIGDIFLTEDVYNAILGWISNHPIVTVPVDTGVVVCFECGSEELSEEGVEIVGSYIYPRYFCEQCDRWLRGINNVGKIANTKGIK